MNTKMLTVDRQSAARSIDVIGVASGLGSPNPNSAQAPDALRAGGLVEHLSARHAQVRWLDTLRPASVSGANPMPAIAELCERVAIAVRGTIRSGRIPLVITGDHSSAVGTWSGVHAALRPDERLGLLWIDAHLDSHTPQTTYSNNIHGMPLAALLGYGDPSLTGCLSADPKLDPRNVCLIGVRSFEPEEAELLQKLGVRVYPMSEIDCRGLDVVMREALQRVTQGTDRFGITLDLDAIDPDDAPGVTCRERGGLRGAELHRLLLDICADDRLACFEICEYTPAMDEDQRTLRLAIEMCATITSASSTDIARPIALAQRLCAANDDLLQVRDGYPHASPVQTASSSCSAQIAPAHAVATRSRRATRSKRLAR